MLNEKRVKHMVKLASYEAKSGEKDLKIISYKRRDYVKMKIFLTCLWTTVGYLLSVILLAVTYLRALLEGMNQTTGILLAAFFVVLYILLLLLYAIYVGQKAGREYTAARKKTKRFLRELEILENMYEREEGTWEKYSR